MSNINNLSPWHKTYWFARMLINTDKYGGIGKDSKLISYLSASLKTIKESATDLSDLEILTLQKEVLSQILKERFSRARSRIKRIEHLITDLEKEITTSIEMEVFLFTCDHIMLPINNALANVPSDDKIFAQDIARAYLKKHGEKGLGLVVKLWDDLGVKGSLTAERMEIVRAFGALRIILEQEYPFTPHDKDIVYTAFVQEFERRVAQKRKTRAGGSLEDVTSFILDFYKIPSSQGPEHFRADIEVDKWIKTKDKWFIGISCKRTIRERWKQLSSAEAQILSNYKIKQLYHILVYDEDLSDDKLTRLGSQRHVFYLPDDSRILLRASRHVGLQNYVRPLSKLIDDIKAEM